jgi:hypothetical protein
MEPPPLPTLEYGGPPSFPQRPRKNWRGFNIGLLSGLAFSVIYYVMLMSGVTGLRSDSSLLFAVIFKIAAGVTLVFFPRWRAIGLGVICSIPIGILILVGLCFGALIVFH